MKVLKFGGTSVGSVIGLLNVKKIVEKEEAPVVVVVSAVGGVTDTLIRISKMACEGDATYVDSFNQLKELHHGLIKETINPTKLNQVLTEVDRLLSELLNIYTGIYLIKDLSLRTADTIVSYGERISSYFISNLIEGAVHFDARNFIKTEPSFDKHVVNIPQTQALIKKSFSSLPKVAIVPGFISACLHNNDVTNLGRGGSDYTAALLAAELSAEVLEIWTDVDGFMTADPRIIDNAYVIDQLSYLEAMELCNFGAKVIYPPTIYPVYHKNIPIKVKNTFNSSAAGTHISHQISNKQTENNKSIKGISSINETSLITVRGLGMVGVIGVNYRLFKALAKHGISVFLVAQASSENSTTLGIKSSDANHAVELLRSEFTKEIALGEIDAITAEHNFATVAIVGQCVVDTPGVAGKLFSTLGKNGINVIACAQGAAQMHVSFVVKADQLKKSIQIIHDSFFLSDYQVLHLFLAGVGTVGKDLLSQIQKQLPTLLQQNALKIKVVAVANSKKIAFNKDGIELSNYLKLLDQSNLESSPEALKKCIIDQNLVNSIFVDCTATAALPEIYLSLLDHNISVVTANKLAASSTYSFYQALKSTARFRGVKFLFETNVGAGLPIINTINALTNSGDTIVKMQAVLSGTLNFIFNTLSAEIPLSKAVKMAQEAGYSEPDPRIDLSGKDVIRKLVILAREAGYPLEQSEVLADLFVPPTCFEGDLAEFWTKVKDLDVDFETRRQDLSLQAKRLRFVAQLELGKAKVGLQEVDAQHPFYDLEGSNNIILITTERYKDYPMMIKGYGAGAAVTAAGVFADIISIANIR